MSTLADQIAFVQGLAAEMGPEHKVPEPHEILRTLQFLQKWEPEIRAAMSLWKAARDDAPAKQLMDTFEGQVVLRHAPK